MLDITTFTLRGEDFQAWPIIDAHFNPPRWVVKHHDPEGGPGYEHGLGGCPQSLEAVQVAAAAHVAELVATGNCWGVVRVQMRADGPIHRAQLGWSTTACGVRLPQPAEHFWIPGAIHAHDGRVFTCGRCQVVNTWR